MKYEVCKITTYNVQKHNTKVNKKKKKKKKYRDFKQLQNILKARGNN